MYTACGPRRAKRCLALNPPIVSRSVFQAVTPAIQVGVEHQVQVKLTRHEFEGVADVPKAAVAASQSQLTLRSRREAALAVPSDL